MLNAHSRRVATRQAEQQKTMASGSNQVAILFADITDSTKLYEQRGDAAARRLVAHCVAMMTASIRRTGGAVVQTMGDGVLAVFPGADAAFDAAEIMQAETEDHPLSIKVGFHVAEAGAGGQDLDTDAVNLAEKVSGLAKAGEVLMTDTTRAGLSADRADRTRFFLETRIPGHAGSVTIHAAVIEMDGGTMMADHQSSALVQAQSGSRLAIRHGGRCVQVDDRAPAVTVGRGTANDLTIDAPFASRRHISVEKRADHYVLTDQSTNGTFVQILDNDVLFLKRESVQLLGSGRIGLGEHPDQAGDTALEYEIADP